MTPPKRYTTLTSREFNQDAGGAKRAAGEGPVYITDRGRAAHVLLSIDDYRALTEAPGSIVDQLAMGSHASVDFEPARLDLVLRPVDLG